MDAPTEQVPISEDHDDIDLDILDLYLNLVMRDLLSMLPQCIRNSQSCATILYNINVNAGVETTSNTF